MSSHSLLEDFDLEVHFTHGFFVFLAVLSCGMFSLLSEPNLNNSYIFFLQILLFLLQTALNDIGPVQ